MKWFSWHEWQVGRWRILLRRRLRWSHSVYTFGGTPILGSRHYGPIELIRMPRRDDHD